MNYTSSGELVRSPDYNTVEGITKYLADLAGLHALIEARNAAWYDREERLDPYILLGRWSVDECGNFARCTIERSGSDVSWIAEDLPPVVRMKDFLFFKSLRICSSLEGLPPYPHSICPECQVGWTLENAHDFVRLRSSSPHGHTGGFEHDLCNRLSSEREILEFYRELLNKAGLPRALITAIPNEYRGDEGSPWCLVRTPFGVLKMGWRKRVFHIDWTDVLKDRLSRADKLDIDFRYEKRKEVSEAFDAKNLFPKEDTTRWESGIHAWGEEKAVEYLKVLSEKVLRKPA